MSDSLLEYISILQGTDSRRSMSYGNTLPLVAMPWGMHHWSLQTGDGPWFFSPNEPHLQGIRLTHQPSPWIGDYASLCIMPQTGPLQIDPAHRASSYRISESILRPDECRVRLQRYRCSMDLAPSTRGAVLRFEFDDDTIPRVIVQASSLKNAGQFVARQAGTHIVDGNVSNHTAGVPDNFAMYYIADFDKPIQKFVAVDDAFYVEFAAGTRRVELRLAGSFISLAQARTTINHELIGRSWEGVRALARTAWLEHLDRFQIDGCTNDQRRTFYSCLYRTLLFPRQLSEIDEAGNELHYSPYDGRVHSGPMYTDTGFWDSYRTVFPFLNWMFPDVASRMMQGLINAFNQGGWLPEWASPGYRGCMIGTHSDAVLADAVVKGIVGFDYDRALEAMVHHANNDGAADRRYGRQGVETMNRLGYLPVGDLFHHATSATMDYAYDDWCIAQVAAATGRTDLRDDFLTRSKRWRNVFDPTIGFMRGKDATGAWITPFNPIAWGGPYVEGAAWQSTWAVPHDIPGLIRALGGADGLVDKIDEMLAAPPDFDCGQYACEVHEMSEMARVDFGQYAHCNQPVHHVLWLYAHAGAPEKAQRQIHRVLNELYSQSPRGLPGDEDNGEMCAWFIFAAMGLYPSCPGSTAYTLGLPWVPRILIRKPDGGDLMINTDQRLLTSPGTRVVRRVDGNLHRNPSIDHSLLIQASRIEILPV